MMLAPPPADCASRTRHIDRMPSNKPLPMVLMMLWLFVAAFAFCGAPAFAQAPPTPAPSEAPPAADPVDPPAAAQIPDAGEQFDATLGLVQAKLAELVAFSPLLLAALLIVLFASWFGGFVTRRLHWIRLRTDNPYMDGLIRTIVRTFIIVLGVVLALQLVGATAAVGAVLGSAGVVGLVLGFAFKDIAENYIAGVLLSLRRPFAPGDHVRIDAHEGKIVALTSRATMLMTLDGNELRLPNALVFKAVITNFSTNTKRRFDFRISIDPAQSIRISHELALRQIASIEGVLTDPGPSWVVQEYAPTGIVLQFFGWVDQRASDLGKVRSEAIRLVKAEFARAGIEQPRSVQHVVMSRERSDDRAVDTHEPLHAGDADTSVNRDIDEQLAEAQQQMDDNRNLLTPGDKPQ